MARNSLLRVSGLKIDSDYSENANIKIIKKDEQTLETQMNVNTDGSEEEDS